LNIWEERGKSRRRIPMKINIYDVAKRAGVSVVTVSRVLNNTPSVRQGNREKVLKAIQELNYQPNASARALARGKAGVVGLLTPSLNDAFMDRVVEAADKYLMEQGLFLALSIVGSPETFEERSNYLLKQNRVDGMILLTPLFEEIFVPELKKSGMPFVLVDNQTVPSSGTSIVVDNYLGGYEAVKYLLSLGHKDILHISGPDTYLSSRERKRGYLDAMRECGQNPLPIYTGQFSVDSGYRCILEAFEQSIRPAAVFAADDMTAYGVIQGLREIGLSVPGDVSVVGFDDHPLSSELNPHLTTVHQPARELGRRAVEELLREMGGAVRRSSIIRVKPQLVVRDSTSVPMSPCPA
jgi:LacI family transcriptional regulator